MSRRLSHGGHTLNALVNKDEDDDDDSNSSSTSSDEEGAFLSRARRISIGARRRSSFGSNLSASSRSPAKSAEEQARIAEMYKTVIKMSSENKINDKNSWSFDLIDHMGKLIRDEGRLVNFQKASCTLDASVKIYSHRVDDTHASSHRILESLTRSGNAVEADDNEVEGSEKRGKSSSRVGAKTASNRHNIADTIEKNVENINSASVESSHGVDPLFQKMSKAFDEGGAKGMLLNCMRVVSGTSGLVFALPTEGNELKNGTETQNSRTTASVSASIPDKNLDIRDVLRRCAIDLPSLEQLAVCPAFDDYRSTIGVVDTDVGLQRGSLQDSFEPSNVPCLEETNQEDLLAEVAETGYFDDGDDDNDYGDGACGDGVSESLLVRDFVSANVGEEQRASNSTVPTAGRRLSTWLAPAQAADPTPSETPTEVLAVAPSPEIWESIVPSNLGENLIGNNGSSEYDYFHLAGINQKNAWAGARHWKFANRLRRPQISKTTDRNEAAQAGEIAEKGEEDEEKPKKRSNTKQKEKFHVDFFGARPDASCFAMPKIGVRGGGDPTVMSSAALEKQHASEEDFNLPPDAKLEVKDLCRMFLCPTLLAPPPHLRRGFLQSNANSGNPPSSSAASRQSGLFGFQSGYCAQIDRVWGEKPKAVTPGGSFSIRPEVDASTYNDQFDDDDDDDGGGNGDCGDNFYSGDGDHFDVVEANGDGTSNCADADVSCMDALRGGPTVPRDRVSLPPESNGLELSTGQLVQATRTVGKVNVGYAKVATRVNVRKLKSDIWSHIERNGVPLEANETNDENTPTNSPVRHSEKRSSVDKPAPPQLSFQRLIRDVGSHQSQSEASLPFYFICLLHLANEKTLTIQGVESMDDLEISVDQ